MDSLFSFISNTINYFVTANPVVAANSIPQHNIANHSNTPADLALLSAAENCRIDGVNQALAMGANVNATDDYGQTALMIAAGKGRRVIVNILLGAQEVNIHHRDNGNSCALYGALVNGRTEIAAILLSSGASIDIAELNTLLEHPKCVKTILSLPMLPIENLDLNGALETAFHNEDANTCKLLISHGADANQLNLSEDELRVAAKKGLVKKVNVLIAIDFPLDSQSLNHADTALIWALRNGHCNIAHFLVSAGANVFLANSQGEEPLTLCISKLNQNKYLSVYLNILNNLTLNQLNSLLGHPVCGANIQSYKTQTISSIQENMLTCLGSLVPTSEMGALFLNMPFEMKKRMFCMASYPTWCQPFISMMFDSFQVSINEVIQARIEAKRAEKRPTMIFSSVSPSMPVLSNTYQPDSNEQVVEQNVVSKKKDRSVLL